jgi:hypothetical protein
MNFWVSEEPGSLLNNWASICSKEFRLAYNVILTEMVSRIKYKERSYESDVGL